MQKMLNLAFSKQVVLFSALTVCAFLTVFKPAFAQEPKIEVAQVNGEIIYLDEVMQIAEQLPAELRQQPINTYFDRLVDEIIDARLAAAAGNEAGLTNNPEILAQMSIAAQRVLAEAYIREELRKSITEEELRKAYDIFVSDTQSREEVKARHILVGTEAEAQEIISVLRSGADFETLAKEKSTGPSGPNGGDLGYFARGAMVPSFENAAFATPKGAITETPVQTQFGWHIIKVEDRRVSQPPSFEQLQGQLQQNLANQSLARIIESLRAPAQITRRSLEEIRADTQAAMQQQQ